MPTYTFPVEIRWTGASGSPGVNVWNVRTESVPGAGDLQDMSDALQLFYTALKTYIPTGVTFNYDGAALEVGDPDASPNTDAAAWTAYGTSDAGFLPPATATCINLLAGSGGRKGRGRKFLSPLAQNCSDTDGTPTSDWLAAVDNAANTLVDTSTSAANGAIGIYSRTDSTFRDVLRITGRDVFAVLRSRRD